MRINAILNQIENGEELDFGEINYLMDNHCVGTDQCPYNNDDEDHLNTYFNFIKINDTMYGIKWMNEDERFTYLAQYSQPIKLTLEKTEVNVYDCDDISIENDKVQFTNYRYTANGRFWGRYFTKKYL